MKSLNAIIPALAVVSLTMAALPSKADEFIRPARYADLLSDEFTTQMIEHSGAFQVSIGDFGEVVFLRDGEGAYTVVGHLHPPRLLPACTEVVYTSRGAQHAFGLCHVEGWQAPANFEQNLVSGYDLAAFLQVLGRRDAPLPLDDYGDLPEIALAITYNGDPQLNRNLVETLAAVMLNCRDLDLDGSTGGFDVPELGIVASRRDCIAAKSANSSALVEVAQDQTEVARDAGIAARDARDAAIAARDAARERLEFAERLFLALGGTLPD